MENINETGKFDMMRDPECLNSVQRIVSDVLDKKIGEIMASSGLLEVEVLSLLRGVPAAGV